MHTFPPSDCCHKTPLPYVSLATRKFKILIQLSYCKHHMGKGYWVTTVPEAVIGEGNSTENGSRFEAIGL